MSIDPVTITRAEAIRRRHEEEQKRRESLVKKTIATPLSSPHFSRSSVKNGGKEGGPAKPKINQTPRTAPVKGATPVATGRLRYDIAMSAPYGRAGGQTRSLPLPKITFGARWMSFLLIVLCGVGLYFITSDSFFVVSSANVIGNNRVSAEEISGALGVMGKSAALLSPAQIEYNLLAAFPDIATAQVEVNLPADVIVTISERQPVAAWQQAGQTVWVDALGYAFPPRGLVEGLVTVSAVGAPPSPAPLTQREVQGGGIGARAFLSQEMAEALMILSPRVPQGSSLVYDPRYGLGWADPRGWQAYFGHTHGDVNAKIQVYQSMVDTLTKQNLTPKLISVEYPDAPFYRIE